MSKYTKRGDGLQPIGAIMKQAGLEPPSRSVMRQIEASVAIRERPPMPSELAFHHTYFCQTALPHHRPEGRNWYRINGRVYLNIQATGGAHPETGEWIEFPLPFGPAARLILIHLDTEAIRTDSPAIDLGGSMTAFVKKIQGGRNPNGPELRVFKEQARSLATAIFIMGEISGPNVPIPTTKQAAVPIVSGLELWYPKDAAQRVLWPSYVHLSPNYFASLQKHAVPLDFRAVGALAHNALALDIYKWLAQRLWRIRPNTWDQITWKNLQEQFGLNYSQIRFFRRTFLRTLPQVLAQYPTAEKNVTWDRGGLNLRLTAPPVPRKGLT